MLAQNKFVRLNIKQKLYKLATALRQSEALLKSEGKLDLHDAHSYLSFLEYDAEIKRVKSAFSVVKPAMEALEKEESVRKQTEILNFAFHDLLEIIGEPIGEKFYQVKLFDKKRNPRRFENAAILENFRSAFNVGNVFRSADSFGVGSLALTGISPHPPGLKIERTAMGTVEAVEWSYFEQTREAIAFYRDLGYKVYALETVEGAENFNQFEDFEKSVFIFGNEEFGISDETLNACDGILEIPLFGIKNSINVSNTFAAVMYAAAKKLEAK